jgi:hypothetical protein
VWREIPDPVSVEWSAPGSGGSFVSSGPAALWKPPDLAVGETRSARVRARLLSATADDPAALVEFTAAVTRTKECEYEREVASEVRTSPGETLRTVTGSDLCHPAELAWKPSPQPITNEASGTVFACTGQLVFLAAKGRDPDTLEVPCAGPCGSDRSTLERPGDLKWLWSTAVQGTFVGFGPTATTSGVETGVVYRAADRPATESFQVLAFNSPGDPAGDPPVARSITVRTFLTDLVLGGRTGTDGGGCPSGFVCLNDDDDDGNGKEDRLQDGVVQDERDLLKVTLVREPKEGTLVFDVPRGGEKVKVWLDPQKEKAAVLPLSVPAAQTPKDLYVEGVATSDTREDVELLLRAEGTPRCEVRRNLTVVRPVLSFGTLDPLRNENPGGTLCLDDDDDDRNGRPDLDDVPATTDDPDLVPLVLDRAPRDSPVTLRLGTDATRIRVFRDRRKASRVAGDTVFQPAELPVTLWVEGTSPSEAKRDAGLSLEDPASGCVERLRLTIWDLELKLHEPVAGAPVVLAEKDEEDPGAVLGVNRDDDDGNGEADLRQHPVSGENDLLKLTAELKPKDAEATLRFAEGLGRLRVWSSPTKGAEVNPAAGIAIRGADGPTDFWLEGVAGSAKKGDVALTLTSKDVACEEKVRLTAFDLQLRADLDFNGRHEAADDFLVRKRGLWLTTNEDDDDRDGVQDLKDGFVAAAGGTFLARDESTLKQVLFVGTLPQGLSEGKVVLRRRDARIRVYRDRRKGVAAPNDAAVLFEGAAAFSAAVEGNGRKSWDLSVPAERTALQGLLADGLWVEGAGASATERDSALTLSYERTGKDAVVLSELPATVVRFEKVVVTVDPTPEIPARVPPNAPARQTFENRRNDVVGYLEFDRSDVERSFEDRRYFVVPRNCDPELDLEVHLTSPVGVAWSVFRAPDDGSAVGTDTPSLRPNGAGKSLLGTATRGSFLVQAWVDVTKDGRFDAGEPRVLVPFVLADGKVLEHLSEAHSFVEAVYDPASALWFVPSSAPGAPAGPPSPGFDLTRPHEAAVHLKAIVQLVGGGPTGSRGLRKVFGGWLQNTGSNMDGEGAYENGHTYRYTYAPPRVFPELPAALLLPGSPAPAVLATPILDANVGGMGGGTSLISPRSSRRSAGELGYRLTVEAVDSPGSNFPRVHPGFPGPPPSLLERMWTEIPFRDYLVLYTNLDEDDPANHHAPPAPYVPAFADQTYVVIYKTGWTVHGIWDVDSATDTASIPTFEWDPFCALGDSEAYAPPKRAEELGIAVRAPELVYNMKMDARN